MTRQLIAIDGIDGSGKTRFAARLEAECQRAGLAPALLRVDDFRRPVAWDEQSDEAAAYYDDYYDFAAIGACVRAFAAGAPEIAVPCYDSVAERVTGRHPIALAPESILILEGVFTLRVTGAAPATLLYLHTSYPEARRRIIARDAAKNRSRSEVERRVERRYFPSQQRYHTEHAPRRRADLVIDNEDPARPHAVSGEIARLPAVLRAPLAAILGAR